MLAKIYYQPKFTFWPKLTKIGRNGLRLARIGPKVEQVVLPFWIASGTKYSGQNGTDLIMLKTRQNFMPKMLFTIQFIQLFFIYNFTP